MISVIKITKIIKIFSQKGFDFSFPVIAALLITINKKILTKGNKKPLSAWAIIMAGIGFTFPIAKVIPTSKTMIQPNLKFNEPGCHFSGFLFPNKLFRVMAEASGAVTG